MKKIAIVTGASRGLGRGIALILATEGNYSVYATARNADALNKLKEEVVSLGLSLIHISEPTRLGT